VLAAARRAGYLALERVEPAVLPASQPSLLRGRGAVWGRLLACRALGVPTPRYRGFPLLRFWLGELTLIAKARSILGTARRIVRRGLGRRARMTPMQTAGTCTPECDVNIDGSVRSSVRCAA
jgi:coenzyme F420 hydrogenase subunit beta